jgi:hypothetical protein
MSNYFFSDRLFSYRSKVLSEELDSEKFPSQIRQLIKTPQSTFNDCRSLVGSSYTALLIKNDIFRCSDLLRLYKSYLIPILAMVKSSGWTMISYIPSDTLFKILEFWHRNRREG